MSQKAKQGGSSAKGKKPTKSGAESKSEDVLQAVVLADSFQDRFKPLTVEKPRCLLPLGNTPLIEYTLEFLAMNGVQEVYMYCGNHTDQVEEYINRSRWQAASRSSPFSVLQFVRVSDAKSVGDVLRDMDSRSLVDGDFILVHGDLVSNILLEKSLAAHRKRRETSAANMMTVVLTSGGDNEHRTKTNGVTPVFAVDSKSQRLLHYDEIHPLQEDHRIAMDPAIPDELSTDFELRADLIDGEIDICTPEVLALWSESFDYELPRKNFLHGVLKDWELNGKMVYADVLEDGYAARASNLQMYDAISRDILGRWTFPFLPENNLVKGQTYKRYRRGVVMEGNVSQATGASLSNSVIGHKTSIGPGTRISNCVIGRNCSIGANVILQDSYVWEDVSIDEATNVTRSIVADGAALGKKSTISEGSIVSFGVIVGESSAPHANTYLSTISHDGKPATRDTTALGTNTNAGLFTDPEDDDLEDDDPTSFHKTLIYQSAHLNFSSSSVSTLASDLLSEEDDELDALDDLSAHISSDDLTGKSASFHNDAVNGLHEELRNPTGDFDSAKLEFMGLRLSHNASDSMMRRAVATAFAYRAAELLDTLEPSKAAEKTLTSVPGATKFVDEVGVGGGEREQIEFVLDMQKALRSAPASPEQQPRLGTLLAALLQQLYALDILEEDGILGWWEDERAEDGEGMQQLKDKCKVLVEWLENAEEEDDSDEDSD
ncbi:eIF4-gamma/eIF5/eIF2-epsilon domain-containing protein [Sarocladium implicatum]|nr:eIF4-gamma/eIF5/eIF2-epsilon domain-containing protein [Sarocladium implicatum]